MFLFGQMVSPSHSHAHEHDHAHEHAHHHGHDHDREPEAPTERCEVCIVAVKDDAEFEATPDFEPVDSDVIQPQIYLFDGTALQVSTSRHSWGRSTYPPPKPYARPDTARAPPSIF